MMSKKTNRIVPLFIDDDQRDLVLIMPGGAYLWTSPREGLPVARKFHEARYHAAIFEYRNEMLAYPEILEDSLDRIGRFRQDPRIDRLFLLGFSAGGHFALMNAINRPEWFSGIILAYPVVSASLEIAHARSIENLLGKKTDPGLLAEVSLEKHVPGNLPPVFVWHTLDDDSVKVENSFRLVEALKAKNIAVEALFYPHGRHGLSVADATSAFANMDPLLFARENKHVSTWFQIALEWLGTIEHN